jgi:hypothetical protein
MLGLNSPQGTGLSQWMMMTIWHPTALRRWQKRSRYVLKPSFALVRQLKLMVPFGTPIQVAFSRDAFLKSGGWDSSLDANFDDIDSWVKIAQFGDAIFINQCLAYRTLWSGAYNQKFSLQKRADTNILIKEKIHSLVSEKYQPEIPKLQDIRAYLKLHWSLVAFKKGNLLSGAKMSFPASFSPTAWKLLGQAARLRQQTSQQSLIQKVVLIKNNSDLGQG